MTDLAGGRTPNRLERRILHNAAAAIVGMVCALSREELSGKPFHAATMLGVTTPCVQSARNLVEEHGDEVVVFSAGASAVVMEEMISAGQISGVLDVTTHELAADLLGGVLTSEGRRVRAAGKKGVPQVLCPGALDMVSFFVPYGIPERYRSRLFYRHNPQFVLMRTSEEECAQLGRIVAQRVTEAKGPTKLIVPMKGWSAYDVEGGPQCVNFEGRLTQRSWFDAVAIRAFIHGVKTHLEGQHGNRFMEVDLHINDPGFARLVAETFMGLS